VDDARGSAQCPTDEPADDERDEGVQERLAQVLGIRPLHVQKVHAAART
jgi:hypothetical protein